MATPETLTKYYDTLKDSFNKIQVKDNKPALVNAALRPKIKEELEKSKDLLISYLNYIKVFTLIYSDKFSSICITVICPLFKDHAFLESGSDMTTNPTTSNQSGSNEDTAHLLHETINTILKSKPELVDEFIQCTIRLFPNPNGEIGQVFINYLSNALKICTYVRGEPLTNLIAKILDRLSQPLTIDAPQKEDQKLAVEKTLSKSYELIYELLDSSQNVQLENVSAATLAAFTREFLTSENDDEMNYLILYICSKDAKLSDLFINLLWATFTNPGRSYDERRASVLYASSFMSRAKFICLDKVLNHLETAVAWCRSCLTTLGQKSDGDNSSIPEQCSDLYVPLVESVLYLITQRYREMYEEDTITRLKNLDLTSIFDVPQKPLDVCNSQTLARFLEVSTLYNLDSSQKLAEPRRKRRRTTRDGAETALDWRIPFKENSDNIPSRISKLYRTYYNHRNFTICRE